MTRDIELRALVARDGRILLFRHGDGTWELPGGRFEEDQDDVDAAMDTLLRAVGIVSANVAEDFLQTVYLPRDGGQAVLNLYAPMEWIGEPAPLPGSEAGWFTPVELAAVPMDASVREAVLDIFGLGAQPIAPGPAAPGSTARERARDVLRTLYNEDPDVAEARLRRRAPELVDAMLDFAMGDVWSGTAIDRRTKSLQVVAMLAALGGRPNALRSHLNGALNHGAAPAQLVETLRMVAVYAGFPAALEAWPIMEEVFQERGIQRGGPA
jgi:alkylhydroperoxidase/carboxymuconolactone decarboxylase family protein YurZ/ADP-ribose pyrophosphatase YjhB (NUDIX family)